MSIFLICYFYFVIRYFYSDKNHLIYGWIVEIELIFGMRQIHDETYPFTLFSLLFFFIQFLVSFIEEKRVRSIEFVL